MNVKKNCTKCMWSKTYSPDTLLLFRLFQLKLIMDMGQNHVQIMRRAILAACRKHIEHLLNEYQLNVNPYRNTLDLVEDLLDLMAKWKAQFVDEYLENC